MNLPKEYIESLKKIPELNVEKLVESFDQPAKMGLRINLKKWPFNEISQENMQKFMKNYEIIGNFEKISWCSNGFYIKNEMQLGKNILHELGMYYIQEPSAMAPVEFLKIQPNDVVLDLCAAPGGKSSQISNKLGNGFLISNEIVPKRSKILAENVERLGLDNVIVTNHSPLEFENLFPEFFDKILVDAPCSGEGMFRKNPEAIIEWNENTPKMCAERQKEIVKSAYKMLKPNGIMVYSTCTFSIEENEEVIKFLLDEFDNLEIIPTKNHLYNFQNGIDIDGTKRLLGTSRLYPYNIDGEGHFFAVLHKKVNSVISNYFDKNNKKSEKISSKSGNLAQKIKMFEKFLDEYTNFKFENFELFGDYLYANCRINLKNIKVVSPGIFLGEFKKDIFIPSMHLARSLKPKDFNNVVELTKNETLQYMQGLEIFKADTKDDWVLLTYKDLPICFGKCVLGKIKNHYPKHLRKNNLI